MYYVSARSLQKALQAFVKARSSSVPCRCVDSASIRPRLHAMPDHYVVAIDQGTQSTRCFVYDDRAQSVACSQQAFQQIYPAKGCDSNCLL